MASYVAIKHTYRPTFTTEEQTTFNTDVWNQLKHLEAEIDKGGALEMQKHYPEGYVFTIALYALAHTEMLNQFPKNSTFADHSKNEIEKMLKLLESSQAKQNFHKELPIEYGTFYTGWLNFVRAKYLFSVKDSTKSVIANKLAYDCQKIKKALLKSKSPFLESYTGMCWPADILACMAAIELNKKINPGQEDSTTIKWLENVLDLVDDKDLIPNMCKAENGEILTGSLGSSQSLILCFMHDIDSALGAKMFDKYKENFLIHRFGLPAIAEYPKGDGGNSHIDSGPIVWDVGAAASIVGIRACYLYGDKKQQNK